MGIKEICREREIKREGGGDGGLGRYVGKGREREREMGIGD